MSSFNAKLWKKSVILSSVVSGALLLTACDSKKEAETQTQLLSIGYQKYGLLPVIKARGELEAALKDQNVQIKWVEFPGGPQLLEGLNVGSVSFGEVGEAPPVFAQAANANLVYVANQPATPRAEALLVQKDSPIQSIAELKGKRVALNKGSNVHYLLLKLLEKHNLKFSDIEVVYLPPSDARAAFERGAVDAWVIWDPFYAAAEHQIGARVLESGEGNVNNYQFYMADRNFVEKNPALVKTLVQELNEASDWIAAHKDEAAQLLVKPTGLDLKILQTSINRMSFGVAPVSTEVAQHQQKLADAFQQEKLIPNKINIQAAIIAPTP